MFLENLLTFCFVVYFVLVMDGLGMLFVLCLRFNCLPLKYVCLRLRPFLGSADETDGVRGIQMAIMVQIINL